MTYFRDNIEAMTGYTPGEQPKATDKVVKLNTNENPYPPSPKALAAMRKLAADALRRYPDPMAGAVRKAAAKALRVPPEWVLVGNGSDDLLSMIFKACCQSGRPAVYPMPTYVYFRTLAAVQNAQCVEVPFDDDYNLPVDELVRADGAVTLIANPNSPSGTLAPLRLLDELAGRLTGLLIVDEAYVDFADENALKLVEKYPNVIVLRTLSKGYSLAGLRLGLAIMRPELMPNLVKVKDHYNVSAVASAVAAAAIADQRYMKANVKKVRAERKKLANDLRGLGFRVWPSQANFLLARPADGDAERVYQTLKAGGILVRYFKEPRLEDKLRITVGSRRQNEALVRAMEKIVRSAKCGVRSGRK